MAEVLNFEHNGITVNATESPEAMGGLGDNVIGLVGTAPKAHASIPKNSPFRINSFTTQALLDPTGAVPSFLYPGGSARAGALEFRGDGANQPCH